MARKRSTIERTLRTWIAADCSDTLRFVDVNRPPKQDNCCCLMVFRTAVMERREVYRNDDCIFFFYSQMKTTQMCSQDWTPTKADHLGSDAPHGWTKPSPPRSAGTGSAYTRWSGYVNDLTRDLMGGLWAPLVVFRQ